VVPGPLRRPKRVRGRVEKSALRLRGGEPQRGEHQEGQGDVGGCASVRLAAAHTARRVQPFEAEERGGVLFPTAREEGSRRREALSARGKALKVKARERCWGETPSAGFRVARDCAQVRGLRLVGLQAGFATERFAEGVERRERTSGQKLAPSVQHGWSKLPSGGGGWARRRLWSCKR
jgi:hypothetical protein